MDNYLDSRRPPGAVVKEINGVRYFVYNGLYYKPIVVSGVTQYQTVQL